MFEFGLYALILLLLALGFIVVPLMLSGQAVLENDDDANIGLAQSKVRELKADLAAGNLSQAQFAAAKHELEIGLYHDLQGGRGKQQLRGDGRWLALPLVFTVPILSLFLYAQLGDFRAFNTETDNSPHAAGNPDDTVNQMVTRLAQRLEQQPNDIQGWLMLGRSYKAMKRYQDAVEALQKALALQKDNADIMLQVADAMAMANRGSLQGEPTTLIEQALKLQPDSEMGMWLSGLSKAELGQYDAAIALWRKLQQRYQSGQSEHREIQELIDNALERLGRTGETDKQQPVAASASGVVNVRVELAEQFKTSVEDNDSVMIYVKAADGPKMPLAAVKRQVRELPLQISFDDSMAMMPNLKISQTDKVIVTARVSRSGNAVPTAGEPVGSISVMGEQRRDVKVVIDDQVR